MVFLIVFGYRSFGKCDYFQLQEGNGTWYYVRTKFFHIGFLPIIPQESYIAIEGQECMSEKVFLYFPEPSQRSIRFGWLRGLLGFFTVGTFFIALTMALVSAGWVSQLVLWILFVISGALLFASNWYKHKATPETRGQYIDMLYEQHRTGAGPRQLAGPAAVNVQAQKPAPGSGSQTGNPIPYGYNQ